MLDTKGFVLLTVCASYAVSELIISSNGWIPITSDYVYNPMQYNFIQHPFKSHTIRGNTINIIKSPNDKDVKKETIEGNSNSDTPTIKHGTSIIKINEKRQNATEALRKPKEIIIPLYYKNGNSLNDEAIKKYDILEEDVESEPPGIADKSNTYEVEEDTYSVLDNEQDKIKVFGYNYMPPTSQDINYNSTLINILSKYNIKPDDALINYDLSRQRKVKIPIFSEISHNPKVLNMRRYNSLNHLPVDPLLAVFLSNYGFYIPSLYGIKSNYNNLYGYLASNNIHNNRPFGLYKIFSDTDSWN